MGTDSILRKDGMTDFCTLRIMSNQRSVRWKLMWGTTERVCIRVNTSESSVYRNDARIGVHLNINCRHMKVFT